MPALALLAASGAALGWLGFRPTRMDRPLLALFSPWHGQSSALRAALASGARLVSPTPLPFGIIVQSSQPDFAHRLHAAGAWLLLDATARGLCATTALSP